MLRMHIARFGSKCCLDQFSTTASVLGNLSENNYDIIIVGISECFIKTVILSCSLRFMLATRYVKEVVQLVYIQHTHKLFKRRNKLLFKTRSNKVLSTVLPTPNEHFTIYTIQMPCRACLSSQNSLNSSWYRFHKMMETFL